MNVLAIVALAGLALSACAQPSRSGAAKATAVPPPPAGVVPSASSGAVPVPVPVPANNAASARHRADLESCYSFAQARIAHDQRIESDSSAAFDAYPDGLGVAEISGRMSNFASRNRRTSLFKDCMRAKGYSQN